MKIKYNHLILLFFLSLLLNCGTARSLTKEKYFIPTDLVAKGEVVNALRKFPKGEKDSFITTMEKTYLNLLMGNSEIDELSKFARDDDNRIRYKISREVKSLVYLDTPEGYYPSEHEIIWMHMLLSWGYSLRGEYDKARVEAKQCSNLLKTKWSEEGRFDDPLMRIMLGALWVMCGDWEEAQVDFRRAMVLDPSLKWAGKLGAMNKQPENLIIILGGLGPEPVVKNKSTGKIRFQRRGKKSNIYIKDGYNKRINVFRTPDSSYWYKRHLRRYHALHDVIKDTQYYTIVGTKTTKKTIITAGGILAGLALITGGIAVGGAIIYVSLMAALSTEAVIGGVGLGLGACGYGIHKGIKVMDDSVNYAEETPVFPDTSRYYRYVRFLPEYAWVGWSNAHIKYPLSVYQGRELVHEISDSTGTLFRKNNILLSYYADSGNKRIFIKKYEDILIKAIRENDMTTFKQIAGNKIDGNAKTSNNKYLLHHTVDNNRMYMCRYLISLDTDVNCRDSEGNTPLHDAIINDNFKIALLLINNRANVNLRNYSQESPLALAVSKNNSYKLVRELLLKGASVESTDNNGWKIIHYAALQNDARVVKLLLNRGAYINSKTLNGLTPLRIAENENNHNVAGLLKKYGAAY